MEMTVNLSGLHPAVQQSVIKGLHHEDKARHDLGVLEQLKLKRMWDKVMAPGVNNNIGRASSCMSEDQVLQAKRLYGELCFADPEFMPFLLKQHPEFRVRDCGTRIQSGYTGRGRAVSPTKPSR